jgi:ribosomal protein S18 acetylase RimI-like enzyme
VPDDRTLALRQARSQRAAYRAVTAGAPTGRTVEPAAGVQASLVPARPARSILNAVLYDDADRLIDAHAGIATLYAAAGVRAWTVWTRPGDEPAARALGAAGHRLDGSPMLMAAAMAELDLQPRMDLRLAGEDAWAALARCNDAAYGLPHEEGFEAVLPGVSDPAARAYVALEDGEPVAGAGTLVHEGDCEMVFVATVPAAQRRGLASELMRRGLRDARDAGCTTASLEASSRGEGVYARLGYRSLGRLGLWELRQE